MSNIQTILKPVKKPLLNTWSKDTVGVADKKGDSFKPKFVIESIYNEEKKLLVKSTNPKIETLGLLRMVGPLQEADTININRRVYPQQILEKAILELKENIDSGEVFGRLDHPTKEDEMFNINLDESSHIVTKVWMEGKTVMGEILILPTWKGPELYEAIKAKVKIGFSARGFGSTDVDYNTLTEDGSAVEKVLDDYTLLTWDAVANPSHRIANTGNMQIFTESAKRIKILNLIKQNKLTEAEEVDARIFDEIMDTAYRIEKLVRYCLNN